MSLDAQAEVAYGTFMATEAKVDAEVELVATSCGVSSTVAHRIGTACGMIVAAVALGLSIYHSTC